MTERCVVAPAARGVHRTAIGQHGFADLLYRCSGAIEVHGMLRFQHGGVGFKSC